MADQENVPSAEERAALVGWTPKDDWHGDPEKWVDAETYLKRSDEVMPFLRQNNRRLEEQLVAAKKGIDEMRANMAEFAKQQQELLQTRLEEQKASLLAERKAARKDGDDDRLDEIEEELDTVNDKIREAKAVPEKAGGDPAKPVEPPPEFQAWLNRNPWFEGPTDEDQDKTAVAMAAARQAAAQGIKGAEYLQYIDRRVAARFGKRPPPNKSEGGGPSGGAGETSSAASYDALPPEAKAQCDADAKRFVGKNKMFADEAAWRKHFVSQYNA